MHKKVLPKKNAWWIATETRILISHHSPQCHAWSGSTCSAHLFIPLSPYHPLCSSSMDLPGLQRHQALPASKDSQSASASAWDFLSLKPRGGYSYSTLDFNSVQHPWISLSWSLWKKHTQHPLRSPLYHPVPSSVAFKTARSVLLLHTFFFFFFSLPQCNSLQGRSSVLFTQIIQYYKTSWSLVVVQNILVGYLGIT